MFHPLGSGVTSFFAMNKEFRKSEICDLLQVNIN